MSGRPMRQPGHAEAWLMRVAEALRARGVEVYARDLGRRTTREVMRAHAWASLHESALMLPGWLRPFARSIEFAGAPPRAGQQLSLPTDERTTP